MTDAPSHDFAPGPLPQPWYMRDSSSRWAAAALAALILLFPGDIPWINDEPTLLGMAFDANAAGRPGLLGLQGTVGLRYGPIPLWIYQTLLLLTHDLVLIGTLKTLLSLLVFAWVFLRLARILRLPPAFLLLVFASPFIHHFVRLLWDGSLSFVMAPVLILAAVESIRLRQARWLALYTLMASMLVNSHPRSVFMIGALYLVILLGRRRDWLRQWAKVTAILGLGALSLVPYTLYMTQAIALGERHHEATGANLLNLLLGARYLSGVGYISHFLPEMLRPEAALLPPLLLRALVLVSALAFLGFAHGLLLGLRGILAAVRTRRDWTLHDFTALMLLLAILLNLTYYLVGRQAFFHHYLLETWFCYGYFVWRSLGALRDWRPRLGAWLIAIQITTLLLLLVAVKAFIHVNGGTRTPRYGATLENQMQVVHDLLQYRIDPAHPPEITVRNYQRYDALDPLVRIMIADHRPAGDPSDRPVRKLVIRYLHPDKPYDGHITLDALTIPPPPTPDAP